MRACIDKALDDVEVLRVVCRGCEVQAWEKACAPTPLNPAPRTESAAGRSSLYLRWEVEAVR